MLLGALLLKLPASGIPGRPVTWLDAMFTATSAATMTGLNVRSLTGDFSVIGQGVIGLLVEVSGLGLIVITTGTFHQLARRSACPSLFSLLPIGRAVRWALVSSLVVQAVGAVVLFPMWPESLTVAQRLGVSLFQSVCAWNQAGFLLLPDGLGPDRFSLVVHAALGPMMFLAGLGAPVTYEIWQSIRKLAGGSPKRGSHGDGEDGSAIRRGGFSAHARVVLIASFMAYLLGVAVLSSAELMPYSYRFFKQGMESNASATGGLDVKRAGALLADASFLSISARTSGLSTRPVDELKKAGQVGLMPIMLVGGGPGSAAGGIGITVWLTMLVVAIWPIEANPNDRADESVRNAIFPIRLALQIGLSMGATVLVAAFLLCLSEPYPFVKVLFEACSAVSNSGLSLGITNDLTAFGKATLVVAMIMGRSLPLMWIGEEAESD